MSLTVFFLWLTSTFFSVVNAGHLPTPGKPPGPAPGRNTPNPPCGQDNTCSEGGSCAGKTGKPVDLWNGREFFTHTDLVLPGLVDIVIQRSYDSQAEYDSALGYGWALNYFMRLYEYTDGSVILRRDCGVRRGFVYTANSYQTPVGETGVLVKNQDGSWTYWEKSLERKEFDPEGKLVAIVSAQGPMLVFQYDDRGRLPLIGLSPYAVEPTKPREVAREFRLIRIEERDASGQPTGRWMNLSYDETTGRLTGISDSAGRTVQYVHDNKNLGNLEEVLLPEGATLSYGYDDPNDPHNATTLTDSSCASCSGGAFINMYDEQDRVIRQQHGMHVVGIDYDIPFVKTRVTEETYDDRGGLLNTAETVYEFNELGNPVRTTDALGNQEVVFRDGRMNIRRKEIWENRGGPDLVLVYAEERMYDARGNVETYTEAKGFPEERATAYTYDDLNHLTSMTVPSVVDPQQNKVTDFDPDERGNVRSRTEKGLLGDGTPFTYVTTYGYDENGRLKSVDGPRSDVQDITTYDYEAGNLSRVTQPLNLITTYSNYTPTGEPQTVTDPNGVATTYDYDSLGRVKSVTIAGDTTRYTYTPTGKLKTVTLPRGNTTTYHYDELDRLQFIEDPLGNTINYTYDSAGNRLKEEYKDPQGTVTKTQSFTYDPLRRARTIINPDGNFAQYQYDARKNLVSFKDLRGNPATLYEYDALNRLKKVSRPSNIVTRYAYDGQNNLASVTNANQNATTYVYDDMGRVHQEISAGHRTNHSALRPSGKSHLENRCPRDHRPLSVRRAEPARACGFSN